MPKLDRLILNQAMREVEQERALKDEHSTGPKPVEPLPNYWKEFFTGAIEYKGFYIKQHDVYGWVRRSFNGSQFGVSNTLENSKRAIDLLNGDA